MNIDWRASPIEAGAHKPRYNGAERCASMRCSAEVIKNVEVLHGSRSVLPSVMLQHLPSPLSSLVLHFSHAQAVTHERVGHLPRQPTDQLSTGRSIAVTSAQSSAASWPPLLARIAISRSQPRASPLPMQPASTHAVCSAAGNSKATSWPVSFLYTPPKVSVLYSVALRSLGSSSTLSTLLPSSL